ncbi:MAG: ATP-binding cassette domain-containing protein [Patescibacteria group bacterium]
MSKRKNQTAIQVTNLTKKYKDLVAVNNISFRVKKGEVFGFLGPNGAGKTTTIRILTGLTKPTSGKAEIFGYDILEDTMQAKKNIGIVPEISNAYGDLTAWENLLFTAQLYQLEKEQAKNSAEKLLKDFGLYERRSEPIKMFSKGMKRRLVIAMGLINNPQLLFLDEPISGLDVESSLLIKDILKDLSKREITIFLTTHNIEEASKSCDRVAIINYGKIAAIDAPEKLKGTIQSVQSVMVSFQKTLSSKKLQPLTRKTFINSVEKLGDKYKFYTHKPEKTLATLWEFSKENNLDIVSLNTLGPNLEDVFVKLTKTNEQT